MLSMNQSIMLKILAGKIGTGREVFLCDPNCDEWIFLALLQLEDLGYVVSNHTGFQNTIACRITELGLENVSKLT